MWIKTNALHDKLKIFILDDLKQISPMLCLSFRNKSLVTCQFHQGIKKQLVNHLLTEGCVSISEKTLLSTEPLWHDLSVISGRQFVVA